MNAPLTRTLEEVAEMERAELRRLVPIAIARGWIIPPTFRPSW